MNTILDEEIAYTSLVPNFLLDRSRCVKSKAGAELNELSLYLKVLFLLENLNIRYLITNVIIVMINC
jgi:hypothetical protein